MLRHWMRSEGVNARPAVSVSVSPASVQPAAPAVGVAAAPLSLAADEIDLT